MKMKRSGESKTKKTRTYVVDHTYRDFSQYLAKGGQVVSHKKSEKNFPKKLHQMLSNRELSHVITWMPHGRCWKVLDRDLLIEEGNPKYFSQNKFASFTRQLSSWGFKRYVFERDCSTTHCLFLLLCPTRDFSLFCL